MNFFRTVYSLCCGTSVFPRLLNVSLWRVTLHTVLLILFCTILITAGHLLTDGRQIRTVTDSFFRETGGFKVSSDGLIRLGLQPEQSRSYILDEALRFDYFPGGSLDLSEMNSWHARFGFICLSEGFVFWGRELYPEGCYRAVFLTPEEFAGNLLFLNLLKAESTPNVMETLAKVREALDGETGRDGDEKDSAALLRDSFKTGLTQKGLLDFIHSRVSDVRKGREERGKESQLSSPEGGNAEEEEKKKKGEEGRRLSAGEKQRHSDAAAVPGEENNAVESQPLSSEKAETSGPVGDGFPSSAVSADPEEVSFDSPGVIVSLLESVLLLKTVLEALFQIVSFLIFGGFFFVLAQYFRMSVFPNRLSFRTIVVIALYAAFPPMLIASLYTALVLPLFSYQMLFFIGYFVYHLLAFHAVMRFLNPPRPDLDDDSDF